jgi:phenylpyruvate tautomerase PptA (4-oxalocrotonate tautomerase family)
MPIVDVEVVCQPGEQERLPSAGGLASALGRIFGSPPGGTWVRVRALDASCYAENDSPVSARELPVFVTVLQAVPPTGAKLEAEVAAVTQAVAAGVAREAARVHVGYAPAGAGRQAFGGRLV